MSLTDVIFHFVILVPMADHKPASVGHCLMVYSLRLPAFTAAGEERSRVLFNGCCRKF